MQILIRRIKTAVPVIALCVLFCSMTAFASEGETEYVLSMYATF